MFQTTLRVLGERTDASATNKALTAAVATFQAEVDVLDPENPAQRPESGGLTAVKKKARLRVVAAPPRPARPQWAPEPAHAAARFLASAPGPTHPPLSRGAGAARLLALHRPRPRRSSLPRPCRQLTDLLLLRQNICLNILSPI